MNKALFSLTAVAVAACTTGCSAVGAVQNVSAAYSSMRGATSAYHATTMLKDLPAADPYFRGYDAIVIKASIAPREKNPELPAAFVANLVNYTQEAARAVNAPVRVCADAAACTGRVLAVNLIEDAYDRNLVQRITVGHLLRGKLIYTDLSTGAVTGEKKVEISESYAQLVQVTNGMILSAMLKSYPPSNEADSKRVATAIEAIPLIAPQYEKALKGAS